MEVVALEPRDVERLLRFRENDRTIDADEDPMTRFWGECSRTSLEMKVSSMGSVVEGWEGDCGWRRVTSDLPPSTPTSWLTTDDEFVAKLCERDWEGAVPCSGEELE